MDNQNATEHGAKAGSLLAGVTGSAAGLTPEAEAWWRGLVKPIFLQMHKRGISEAHIIRDGTKCRFELIPEPPNPQ